MAECVMVVYRGPSGTFIAREAEGDITFALGGDPVEVARDVYERLSSLHTDHTFEVVARPSDVQAPTMPDLNENDGAAEAPITDIPAAKELAEEHPEAEATE